MKNSYKNSKGKKMNRILLISISLLIFIVGISCVSAADLDVNDTSILAGSGLGGGGDNGPFYMANDEISIHDNAYDIDLVDVDGIDADNINYDDFDSIDEEDNNIPKVQWNDDDAVDYEGLDNYMGDDTFYPVFPEDYPGIILVGSGLGGGGDNGPFYASSCLCSSIGSGSGIGSYSTSSTSSIGAAGITFHGGSSDDGAFGPNHGNNHPDIYIPPGVISGSEGENHNLS